jgi:translocation and assembly module TamB
LTAQGGGRTIALPGPATLTYGKDGLAIQNFALRIDNGRLSPSGRAGPALDLRATATALPLAALDLVSPGLGASGTADGDATIRGTPGDPSGDWRIRLRQTSFPQTRNNGLPPLDVTGSGRLAGGRTSADVTATAGGGNSICVTGSSPLSSDGALDLKIDGKLDAGLANNALSLTGRRVTGAISIAAQVRGTVAKPQAQSSIRLVNGEFRDEETGFKLTGIEGVLVASGDAIRIDRLSGATPDGGTISATGDVRLDSAAGFPGTIRVTGKHAQVVANSVVTATADIAVTVSGRLAQKPNVDGHITIESMDVTVPDRFAGVSAPFQARSISTRHRPSSRASPKSPGPRRRTAARLCSMRR